MVFVLNYSNCSVFKELVQTCGPLETDKISALLKESQRAAVNESCFAFECCLPTILFVWCYKLSFDLSQLIVNLYLIICINSSSRPI